MSCCAWWKGLDVGQDTGEGSSVLGQDNSYHNHCTLLPCSLLLLHSCMENQSFGLGPKLSSFPSHFWGGWLEKSNNPKGQKVRIFNQKSGSVLCKDKSNPPNPFAAVQSPLCSNISEGCTCSRSQEKR